MNRPDPASSTGASAGTPAGPAARATAGSPARILAGTSAGTSTGTPTGAPAFAPAGGLMAVVFPGQGAQSPGMGLDLARAYPATAGVVFETADRVLGFRLSRVIAAGDQRLLARTEITQPALMAASLAAWQALRAELPHLSPAYAAGLSLGEYSALAAARTLDLVSVFRLVAWRGRFMEDAARDNPGSMCAVLGLERERVEGICAEARAAGHGHVTIANYNAPGQNVVTGEALAVHDAAARAVAAGGRAVPLKVSGGFHSRLVTEARRRLAPLLASTPWRAPDFPVYANATAQPHGDALDISRALELQVTSPVLWEDIIRDMWARGVRTFVECGPGKTLSSLIARIVPGAETVNVSDLATLARAATTLGAYALEVVS